MKITERLAMRNQNPHNCSPIVIACLGDSVTQGCFEVFINRHGNVDTVFDQENGYVSKLRHALTELYPAASVSIINAGISGDNARNGLVRLEKDVLRHQPDLVTVNFGLNDSMHGMNGLQDYLIAMDSIFEKVLASGAECMLVTPNRMCAYVSHNITEERLHNIAKNSAHIQNTGILDAYVEGAKQLAYKHGIAIADAYQVWNDMEQCGVDTTTLLSNEINHPLRNMHWIFVEQILSKMFEGGKEK